MKHFYYSLSLFLIFATSFSFSIIPELSQLQQSLQKITSFLSKTETEPITPPETSVKPKITTYEELKKVMETAYEYNDTQKKFTAKNPDLLNNYEQTVAVTTAQYLAQELLKKDYPTEWHYYIPFMAYVAQQVTEQYPDKTINLHCISLAAGELDKELLLIRALRFVGYKTITLIAIDLMYIRQQKRRLQNQFERWCKEHNILISSDVKNPAVNGVTLQLFNDSYHYLEKFYADGLPKNHLFLMIQPSRELAMSDINKLRSLIIGAKEITYNYLYVEDKIPEQALEIYLPYNKSDFFVTSTGQQNEIIIKSIKEEIQKWTGTTFSQPPKIIFTFKFYQQALILKLIETFFIQKEKEILVGTKSDVDLCFCDLIQHTALKPAEPLAFTTLNLKMQQITDMSGSLEQIYKRYF
jgi:hypothetical protein